MSDMPRFNEKWAKLQQLPRALVAVDLDTVGGEGGWNLAAIAARLAERPAAAGRAELVDLQGRGLVMRFEQPAQALDAALGLQRGSGARPGLRVGAEVDHPSRRNEGPRAAQHLARQAEPGEVLLSPAMRDQIVAGLDAEIEAVSGGEASAAFRARPCLDEPTGTPAATDGKPVLFLMPLRVAPGNRCDPVHAELVNHAVMRAMSQNKGWNLISRQSAEAFRHRGAEPATLRRRLRATHVMSGAVATEGKRLSLQIQMVDSSNGRTLWQALIQHPALALRSPDNPFGREVVRGASGAIFGEVIDHAGAPQVESLAGWRLLFSAMLLMHRTPLEAFNRSRTCLEQLIARHPRSSDGHAWMAKWHVMRVARGLSPDIEADVRLAQQWAQRGLDGEGDQASSLAIDGHVQAFMLRDLPRAEAQLSAAIALNPNESLAWLYLSAVYAYQDRGTQAAEAASLALMLSPLDPMRYYFDAFASHAMLAAGRINESIVLASRSISANPRHVPALRTLAIARAMNAQEAQAREAVAALRRVDPRYGLNQFIARYPGQGTPFAERSAQALRLAGLPP
jgi:adenylate cyclase